MFLNQKLCLFFLVTGLFCCQHVLAQCDSYEIINLKKIAIVFGEKAYKSREVLNNTINDAMDISDSLKKVGFDVYTYEDTDLKTMNDASDNWCSKLFKYDVALFYFSGHGAELNGENFLFPIDINPKGPSDLNYQAYSANKLLERLDHTNLKYSIIILDACRNNPFTKGWARGSSSEGLAAMSGRGTFIAYAASPGATAQDGNNHNSPFTEGILKNIMTLDLPIDQIFNKVNFYVRTKTGGEQKPFKTSSFSSDYCFNVALKKKTAADKPSTFLQPVSSLFLSPNQQYLFAVDSLDGGLLVKDPKTLITTNILLKNQGSPVKITGRDNENLYLLDSINRRMTVYNWKSNIVGGKIILQGAQITFTLALDSRKAYIAQNLIAHGSIAIVDTRGYSIVKSISLPNEISGMVMSTNGRYLYVSSKNESKESILSIIDLKSEKLLKSIPGLASGTAIGVTPDNKFLFTATNSGQVVNVIDNLSFKTIKSLQIDANSFAFDSNSNYLFALSESKITVVRMKDLMVTNELPFVTKPTGIAISNDGTGYVWLPEEKRVFTFDINQQNLSRVVIDPESVLKKFKEEINNNPTITDLSNAKKLFETLTQEYYGVINKLREELGYAYNISIERNEFNSKLLTNTIQIKLGLDLDPLKFICPTTSFSLKNNNFIITMIDPSKGKTAETFSTPANHINYAALNKFIRDYYSLRVEQLK